MVSNTDLYKQLPDNPGCDGMNYKQRSFDLAKRLDFEIIIEHNRVYLQSGDAKSEFMTLDGHKEDMWHEIWRKLQHWGDGCNLIRPVDIAFCS